MVELSIIIVSYNTKNFLRNCIESIISSTDSKIKYEIIIVDNNSSDGTVEAIQNYKGKLKIIQNKTNYGFSKANNQGVKKAGGEYLLFLNPDVIVYRETLRKTLEFIKKHKDIGAATCKVVLPNGELDDASHRGFPTPLRALFYFLGVSKLFPKSLFLNGYHLGYKNLNRAHEIDSCAGAFMMVRKAAGEQIRWWDEDFFWYGDDLDFCYRLKEKGWKIYYFPLVSVLHYKGVSSGIKKVSKHITTADENTKILAVRARFEAMKIFYKKHYKNRYPKFITWLVRGGINLKLWITTRGIN